jgi:4-hydroxy-3-methylbut-2-en-1-yl diphosphate synthase IspG/GcpE
MAGESALTRRRHLLAQLSSTSDALVKSLVTTATVHSVDGLQVELHDTRADCGAVTAEDVDHLRALFESLRSKLGSGFHLGITVPGMVFPGVTNARALAAALDDITIMVRVAFHPIGPALMPRRARTSSRLHRRSSLDLAHRF